MVAELVETTRLWGRTAAAAEIKQVEALAEHLVKRSYGEPRWDRRRAAVVASERVTLYGLPIVESRTVQYGRIDPAVSRELFIRRALVEGDWDQHHAVHASRTSAAWRRSRRSRRGRGGGTCSRRGDAGPRSSTRGSRPDVVSGRHFDRWWKEMRRTEPTLLDYPMEMLIEGDVAAERRGPAGDLEARPPLELALSYRFDPGSAADGVTAHIPLASLGAVQRDRL